MLFLGQLWRVSTFLLCVVNRNDDQGNMAEILADGQVSQDRSYIHLRQNKRLWNMESKRSSIIIQAALRKRNDRVRILDKDFCMMQTQKVFIESCGEYNRSMIQIYSLEKKKVFSKQRIPGEYFGIVV